MKICFLVNCANEDFFCKVAAEFINTGKEVCCVLLQPNDGKAICNKLGKDSIYSPAKYMKEHRDYLNYEQLNYYQGKYDDLSLWDIYYADRWISTQKKEDAYKFIVGYIMFFEEVFEKEKPDIFFYEVVSNFTAFMGKYIGEKYGVRFMGYIGSRFDFKNTLMFSGDEHGCHKSVKEMFFSKYVFTEEEKRMAKELINSISKRADQPDDIKYLAKITNNFFFDLLAPLRFLKVMILSSRRSLYFNRYDYVMFKRFVDYKGMFLRFFNYIGTKKYFYKPRGGEKYFFFPLQYQPEASTLLAARKYVNQLFFIEQLAKSLPAGYKLYIKDHVIFPGHKPVSFFKNINKFPNVHIINPEYSIHELINRSYAVIVLTATTALEA